MNRDLDSIIDLTEDPFTAPEVLAEFAHHWSWQIRSSVASNPSTPPEALIKLASDPDERQEVVLNVASNPSAPAKLLTKLAHNSFWSVRYKVATNHSVPVEVLTKLAFDEDCYVQAAAINNEKVILSRHVLEILLLDTELHDEVIEILIKKNKNNAH
jgi:hypothetical protein